MTDDRGKLKVLIAQLRGLRTSVTEDLGRELQAQQPAFVHLQQQQLEDGENAAGEQLEYMGVRRAPTNQYGTYAMSYSIEKAATGGQVQVVDLKRWGNFHRTIVATAQGLSVVLRSTDPDKKKTTFIERFYRYPVGLSPDSLSRAMEKLAPSVQSSVVKKFTLS